MWPSARPDTVLTVKRLVNGLLIVAVLATVALGAYAIGTRVDNESNKLSSQDSELGTTVAAAPTHTTKSNRTPVIIGVALGGAVLLLLLGSGVSAVNRSRRRERWRAG
jgi:hypothetical protein